MNAFSSAYLAYFQSGDRPPLAVWVIGTAIVIGLLAAVSYFRRKT